MSEVLTEKDFSNDKLKNIKEMYSITRKAYEKVGHGEVALIFKEKCAEQHHDDCNYYDTQEGAYLSVEMNQRKNSSEVPFHTINIKDTIDNLNGNAKRNGNYKCNIAVIHNHPCASSFNLVDLYTFFSEDSIKEIYLDSSSNILMLRKIQARWTNPDINDLTKYIGEIEKIIRDVTQEKKGNRFLSVLLNSQVEQQPRSLGDLRNLLIAPTECIHYEISNELWQRIDERCGVWLDRAEIPKEFLIGNIENDINHSIMSIMDTKSNTKNMGDELKNVELNLVEGDINLLNPGEAEFISFALGFFGLNEINVLYGENQNIIMMLFDKLDYDKTIMYTEKCQQFLLSNEKNDFSYALLAESEVEKCNLFIIARFLPGEGIVVE
jgi:hypothetical protein